MKGKDNIQSKPIICPDCKEQMIKESIKQGNGIWKTFWVCGCVNEINRILK